MLLARTLRGALGLVLVVTVASCKDWLESSRAEVASVSIEPSNPSVVEGDSIRLEATVWDEAGNALRDRTVFWATGNPDVVSVSDSGAVGTVTGLAAGTAEVAAVSEAVDGRVQVTVLRKPPARLEIVGESRRQGTVGSTLPESLAVRVADEEGEPLSGVAVAWSVTESGGSISPTETATNDEGVATTSWTLGTTPGEYTVTATVSGVATVQFVARTEVGAPETVEIVPDAVRFGAINSVRQLQATARDRFGNPVPDARFVWRSSEPQVATVDAGSGVITSRGNGTTVAEARIGEVSDRVMVEVRQIVNSVSISPPSFTLYVGGAAQLIASAADSNGVSVPDVRYAWSSSNVTVASVDQSGRVTGLTPGSATITAEADGARGASSVEVQLGPAGHLGRKP